MDPPDSSSQTLWNAVDGHLAQQLHAPDPLLDGVLARSKAAGLPEIQVSEMQGKFLHLLARIHHTKRILEIGTLAGYSAIWLARALPPEGKLLTLEIDSAHAQVARANLRAVGLADRVEVRVGPALEILAELSSESQAPFDLIFIDADKPSNVQYLEWAVKLGRPGTVIALDNIVRNGAVVESGSADANVQGARAALQWLGAHPRLESTALQTVGSKGHDGFALAILR